MGVMAALTVPANMFDSRLMDLVALRIANLSVEHGNCEESSMDTRISSSHSVRASGTIVPDTGSAD